MDDIEQGEEGEVQPIYKMCFTNAKRMKISEMMHHRKMRFHAKS